MTHEVLVVGNMKGLYKIDAQSFNKTPTNQVSYSMNIENYDTRLGYTSKTKLAHIDSIYVNSKNYYICDICSLETGAK